MQVSPRTHTTRMAADSFGLCASLIRKSTPAGVLFSWQAGASAAMCETVLSSASCCDPELALAASWLTDRSPDVDPRIHPMERMRIMHLQ